MSWLILEGPNEKMGVLSFEQETCPKTGLRRSMQSGVSIYNTVTIVSFCKFVLAKHDEVITLSAAGVAQSFSLVPW